jgi:hypothetical protein
VWRAGASCAMREIDDVTGTATRGAAAPVERRACAHVTGREPSAASRQPRAGPCLGVYCRSRASARVAASRLAGSAPRIFDTLSYIEIARWRSLDSSRRPSSR